MRQGVELYGLGPFLIASEVAFPELSAQGVAGAALGREPDVRVRLGRAPETIEGVVANETRWWASRTEYLQRVPRVATFYVRDGREVVVDPAPGAPPEDIRAYLLAPIFSQLCFQAGRYALHASSVRVGSGVAAFAGDSGAGKSTVAAYLTRGGGAAVSDDLCLLETETAEVRVIPVAPALKLWPSALRVLGAPIEGLPRVWSQEEKFRLPMSATEERLPLREVVFLEWNDDGEAGVAIDPVGGVEATTRLLRLMHFEYLMKPTGRQAECFRLCGRLLGQVRTSVLRRPKDFGQMDRVMERLAEYLGR
ncbi:MAG: hypothetical protein M3O02_03960 [Acidobacteriota bacterium]|nr:hypothetical protein [Acidobacteriota bacterium]